MIYNYLSLPLAILIAIFDIAPGMSKNVSISQNSNSEAIVYSLASSATTQANSQDSGYLGLMNAGYAANEKRDYLQALEYFQQALKIQPEDSKAQIAIAKVGKYGFDRYMQEGYAADRIRDYRIALQNFQKALQINPDSWYAQQAVSNVSTYLAQQPVVTEDSEENADSGFGFVLFLMGVGTVLVLFGGLLFYFFNKTGNSSQELDTDKLEPLDSLSPVPVNKPKEEIKEISPSSQSPNINSTTEKTQQPQQSTFPASNQEPAQDSITTISTHKNLAKLDIVPELIEELNSRDRSIRRKTVWELAQRGDSRAMKPLVELMVEVDSQERGLILEAMTQIASRTLKPMNKAIMMSLEDNNSQVKQNAIRDLTRVYDLMSQVTKRLSLAVDDSDAQVQDTAKWALKKLNQIPANSWQVNNFNNQINGTNSVNSDIEAQHESGDNQRYPLN